LTAGRLLCDEGSGCIFQEEHRLSPPGSAQSNDPVALLGDVLGKLDELKDDIHAIGTRMALAEQAATNESKTTSAALASLATQHGGMLADVEQLKLWKAEASGALAALKWATPLLSAFLGAAGAALAHFLLHQP
jgi:hypothetical protein